MRKTLAITASILFSAFLPSSGAFAQAQGTGKPEQGGMMGGGHGGGMMGGGMMGKMHDMGAMQMAPPAAEMMNRSMASQKQASEMMQQEAGGSAH